MSLNIDMTPMWDAINTNLPMFFQVYAPVIGISAAIAIVTWLASAIVSAFRNGGRI